MKKIFLLVMGMIFTVAISGPTSGDTVFRGLHGLKKTCHLEKRFIERTAPRVTATKVTAKDRKPTG
jgi:hypothetical protein